MKEKMYDVSVRFYDGSGKLLNVDHCPWFFLGNAKEDAQGWLKLSPRDLLPTNISVRGPDGRFVKWRN